MAAVFVASASAMPAPLVDRVGWAEMLGRHDLVWGSMPKRWDQAPFLGNGEQGTLMYEINRRSLRWDVGCSAAHDHRPFEKDDLSEKGVAVLNRGRHFIGHLRVELPEDMTGGQARLDLWNAEARGTVEAKGGELSWRTLVHAREPVMKFEMTPSGSLADAKFVYVPEKARSARAVRAKSLRKPANPDAVSGTLPDGVRTSVQHLWAGGQTAVAYLERNDGGKRSLWLSVQHSFPGKEAEAAAVKAVRTAAATDQSAWTDAHRAWWHDYYPASFVSTGDPYWDSFYWIQQYKLACATRDKGWIIDNQGPWLQPTAWNATWWNLNVQLSHSGTYQANRRGMASALSHRLDINRANLRLNVAEPYREDSYAIGRTVSGWDLLGHAGQPGGREPMDRNIGRECANLLWGLHNVDLEVRYWQDAELRDRVLFPLLVGAVNYYCHFLVEEDDGLLHIPNTHSPEFRNAEDCSYDLDLLRWGVGRLLEIADERGLSAADEPLIPKWREIEEKLVPTHVNETGRMLGKNAPLNGGHRHWSHLMAIYPLRTLTPEDKKDRELIEKSLKRWHSFGRGIAGYAFTGASCMSSLLGDGEGALTYLNQLKSYLKPSTLYSEIGLPVMETPLHGATAIQEMLLQSWGGRLRVLPAVPGTWPDVQFSQLRGEGAFLVSARRGGGSTKWVLVESEVGGVVEVEPQLNDAAWVTTEGTKVSKLSPGVYRIDAPKGGMAMFWPEGTERPAMEVSPVRARGAVHRFGLPKGYRELAAKPE
ncbi:glycosyl hydrolase family 95 catalytic domain-containing protein [Haloferula rosea]|uniref:Glycosyl hydrolase family 95 catalytic domain-containing protein n=1 Tax=Haloferula rosea TaxID=490093 RepID=A0A934VBY3_9BACT|nr:hypothetical protein [Haloferula rosea]MBK1827868.1 hypothetical protein [Haloferula rosea]